MNFTCPFRAGIWICHFSLDAAQW